MPQDRFANPAMRPPRPRRSLDLAVVKVPSDCGQRVAVESPHDHFAYDVGLVLVECLSIFAPAVRLPATRVDLALSGAVGKSSLDPLADPVTFVRCRIGGVVRIEFAARCAEIVFA